MQFIDNTNLTMQNRLSNSQTSSKSVLPGLTQKRQSFDDLLKKNLATRSSETSAKGSEQVHSNTVKNGKATESGKADTGSGCGTDSRLHATSLQEKTGKEPPIDATNDLRDKTSLEDDVSDKDASATDQLLMMISTATNAPVHQSTPIDVQPQIAADKALATPPSNLSVSEHLPGLDHDAVDQSKPGKSEDTFEDHIEPSKSSSKNNNILESITNRTLASNQSELITVTTNAEGTANESIAPNFAQVSAALSTRESQSVASNQKHVSIPVASEKWGQAVGEKISWMVKAEISSATLTLNPPDLGPMKVVISVENDQANASFSADQPEVRQALLDSMPKLRDAMNDAGIELGRTSVSDFSSDSQPNQNSQNPEHKGRLGGNYPNLADEEIATAQIVTKKAEGLIDTFV